jgi:hypothetical protein
MRAHNDKMAIAAAREKPRGSRRPVLSPGVDALLTVVEDLLFFSTGERLSAQASVCLPARAVVCAGERLSARASGCLRRRALHGRAESGIQGLRYAEAQKE